MKVKNLVQFLDTKKVVFKDATGDTLICDKRSFTFNDLLESEIEKISIDAFTAKIEIKLR